MSMIEAHMNENFLSNDIKHIYFKPSGKNRRKSSL